ncbi:MAG: CoB--CoM heterodisulfide reductase iron-sulfur subunit A family protein [Candidatus Aminicenantes bacterium]|nr:CoB--CoM heterodisulfide reductase iron-sulfur subunit A family protein [Candidatus Aminicenantes bacterium]
MKRKIGVYICHCGGNISDYVDVEKVRQAAAKEAGVALARTMEFACADSSQKEIAQDIQEGAVDSFVVASCSPKLHLPTFQSVAERAGLNKYQYVHANIREQVSWAHSDDKEGATAKAVQFVRAAIAKVRLAKAIEPIEIQTQRAVLVVGAGVAGMKAATSLAKMGVNVYLIEKEHFVGGRVSQWDVLCITEETGKDLVTRFYIDVVANQNITLFTGAELVECSGSMGNFTVKVRITPRYVKDICEKDRMRRAIEVCPVEVVDEFNFSITKRKAIYHNFPSQYPLVAVVDMKHCTRCGKCEKECEKIDFSQEEKVVELKVGSILVAAGFDPYTPKNGEFGYQVYDNVITLPQFKRLVAISDTELKWKGRPVQTIAYIYCVGSRQLEGENKYCSRYCCLTTICAAIKAGEKFSGLSHFHFTRGIRTYGKYETFFYEASKRGQVFLQSFEDDPPQVTQKDGRTLVRIHDILTSRREVEVDADLVVLVTGMVPRTDGRIGEILKLPRGRDRFYNEIHMKLRPVETVIDGVTIAGACRGPQNVVEAINSSLSAAIKSYSFVRRDTLAIEPIVAEIDPDACTWCEACAKACPFDAIARDASTGKEIARVNTPVCKGCGMCLPVCPANAIQLRTFSDEEVQQMIGVLAHEL